MKILILFVALFALSSAQNLGSTLNRPNCMNMGQWMISPRNCFRMEIQPNGSLVITRVSDRRVVWTTNSPGGHVACMLNDGNFVLRNSAGTAVWQTNTSSRGGEYAIIQDDAQLVIRTAVNTWIWASGLQMFC